MTDATTTSDQPVPDGGDPAVRPQDDLFGYVNGAWYATAEIPPDLPITGAGVSLLLEAEAQVDEILRESAEQARSGEAVPGSARQQIGDLYTSFLDTERLESLGVTPLDTRPGRDRASSTRCRRSRGLTVLSIASVRDRCSALRVNTDDRKSRRYVVNITQGGHRPARRVVLPRGQLRAETRAAYVAHVTAMFGCWADADDDAAAAADAGDGARDPARRRPLGQRRQP